MRTLAGGAAVLAGLYLLSARGHAQVDGGREARITVHVDQPTVPLPASLYGLFYEDINYSGDGGLYAELVQNRSFEYYPVKGWNRLSGKFDPLYSWRKIETGGGACELTVETAEPLNDRNTKYARLTIVRAGKGVGLANTGYDGICVVGGDTYDFSIHARRTGSFDEPLRVTIRSASGGDLGGTVIKGLTAEWKRYEASIRVKGSDEKASLAVVTSGEGDVFMDMISLFPRRTFKGRRNGLRRDLARALADLRPAVFRFTGGCIVHGHGLDNAYRWKDTVGDVAERKPNWNLWGYHQSYGLGYYEYFLLCEDLGAEPLPILPVGVSCGFRKPFQNEAMGKLKPWVDDALDLIEFANGSTDTKWGALRAEMGHPEPFKLKYIGLGNEEHHTKQFEERFAHFVRAIRARDPEIKIVGTSGLGPGIPIYNFMTAQGVDVSDEHYYMAPEWFIQNQNRFDNFDRAKPKVFVGEYASRGNTLYNAVAEAVFLTGIERNADIVHMTAYAPLFARYRFTQWRAANLIWFDHKTVVRTPNYHVQQMFSLNKGDVYLRNETEIKASGRGESPAFGRVGVGTWLTSAEFDDVKVQCGERTLIDEPFAGAVEDWRVVSGRYAVRDGVYVQSDRETEPALSICPTSVDATGMTYSLRAKKTGGREGFLILFGSRTAGGYYWWNVGGWGNTQHAIEKGGRDYRTGKTLVARRRGSIRSNVWYGIRIEITGGRIRCFLDNKLVHDVEAPRPRMGVAASREKAIGDILVKIANPMARRFRARISLRGVDAVEPTATLTLLTGNRNDANDLGRPDRVKPVVSRIPVAREFDYTIAPTSVQIIRIGGE